MKQTSKKLPQNNSPRAIFIDTQIIQYSADKNRSKSEAFSKIFEKFKRQGYELAISEIVLVENLHGIYGIRNKKMYKHLSQFVKKIVSEDVLLFAAAISGLYKEEGSQDIRLGDKIIAATAFLEKGLILTRNHKDFPPPFFESIG